MKKYVSIFLFIFPCLTSAYSVDTHARLTENAFAQYAHLRGAGDFSPADIATVAQGAVHEDEMRSNYFTSARPLNHFYDPIHNSGLNLAGKQYLASPLWAIDTKAQANYGYHALGSDDPLFSGDGDYSWNRGVYEYVHGDRKRALQTLGHVMHLLEDATSPAHTRNDPHPGGPDNDPYEDYTATLVPRAVITTQEVPYETKPEKLIQDLAMYTNTHFFSRDTVNAYSLPQKDMLKYKEVGGVGYGKNDGVLVINMQISRNPITEVVTKAFSYPDEDPIILTSNWNALSHKAVVYGVGLIDLFMRDVARERSTHALLDINKSEVQIAALQDAQKLASNFSTVKRLYGSSLSEEDLEDLNGDEWKRDATLATAYKSLTSPAIDAQPIPQLLVPVPAQVQEILTPDTMTQQKVMPPVIKNTDVSSVLLPMQDTMVPTSSGIVLGAAIDTTTVVPQATGITAPASPASVAITVAPGFGGGGGGTYTSEQPPAKPPVPDCVLPQVLNNATNSCEIPSDTTPPSLELHASTCIGLKDDKCLVFPGVVDVSIVTDGDIVSVNGVETTERGVVVSINDSESKKLEVVAKDEAGNTTIKSVTIMATAMPLRINEVAVGTTEWIELLNTSDMPITLDGFSVTLPKEIPLSGTLASHGYYVLAKDGAIVDVPNVYAYTNDTALQKVALMYYGKNIDETIMFNTSVSASYERYDVYVSGVEATNWNNHLGTAFPHTGKTQAGNPIEGTPGQRNATAMNPYNPQVRPVKDYTLLKSKSPYVVYDFSIPKGITVTVEPGVVIKMSGNASIPVLGTLNFNGSASEPVLITSLRDDTGSDTNYDGAVSTPQSGDWQHIYIEGSGSVTGTYTTIAFGGSFESLILQRGGTLSLMDSTLIHSLKHGVSTESGVATVTRSVVSDVAPTQNQYAVFSRGGSLTISTTSITRSANGIFVSEDYAPNTFSLTGNVFSHIQNHPIQINGGSPSAISGNSGTDNAINAIILGLYVKNGAHLTLQPNALPYRGGGQVLAGGSLTLLPGTTLECEGGTACSLQVQGTLTALGANPSDILFTSAIKEPGSWGGISVLSGGVVTLSGATISYAGHMHTFERAGISAHDATVTIRNSLITDTQRTGIDSTNTALQVSDSVIQNVTAGPTDQLTDISGIQLRGTSTYAPSNVQFKNTGVDVVQN